MELTQTKSLQVQLGAPDLETLVIHPQEGRNIDVMTQTEDFNLYLNQDDFINATDNYIPVTLDQQNDFDRGAIQIKNKLKKQLGNPDSLRIFRKKTNLFLKP